jgi:antitoxin (DNA-binding transcriptional repressor) of toxin-antitoxin stability system
VKGRPVVRVVVRGAERRSRLLMPRNLWLVPAQVNARIPHDNHLDVVASGSYIASMRAVGLKLLKNRLSEYVRMAARGETVLVTDRDRVVAELVPPRQERAPVVQDAMLADAVRNGWLTPPLLPGESSPPRARKPVAPLAELLAELAADRGEP